MYMSALVKQWRMSIPPSHAVQHKASYGRVSFVSHSYVENKASSGAARKYCFNQAKRTCPTRNECLP